MSLATSLADMELFVSNFTMLGYVLVFFFLVLMLTKWKQAKFPHAFAILVIIFLTFHVGYMSIYDFTHYAGPINDILQGVPPLSFPSPYGFLSVITLSLIFKVIPLSLFSLHLVNAVIVTAGFLAFYVLSTVLIKNQLLAFFAAIGGIATNWLTGIGYRGSFPQSGMLRFGVWLPIGLLLALQTKDKKHDKYWRILTFIFLTLALFWTLDTGIYVLGAYLISQWFLSLERRPIQSVKRFMKKIAPTLLSVSGGFVILSVGYLIVWGALPAWQTYLWKSATFLSGPLLIPLPDSLIPWLMLAPNIILICVTVARRRFNQNQQDDPLDQLYFFIAWYAVLQFAYFVARSHLNNLHHIILPSVLSLFILVQYLNKPHRIGVTLLLSVVLAFPVTLVFSQAFVNLKHENFLTTMATIRHPQGTEQELFGPTAKTIETRYEMYLKTHDVGFLSFYDTWYLVLLKTTNPVGSNCLACYSTSQEVGPIISAIVSRPPKYLLVDQNQYIRDGQVSWIFPRISFLYAKKESIGDLDVYERK